MRCNNVCVCTGIKKGNVFISIYLFQKILLKIKFGGNNCLPSVNGRVYLSDCPKACFIEIM